MHRGIDVPAPAAQPPSRAEQGSVQRARPFAGRWELLGLSGTDVLGLAIDPGDSRRMLATCSRVGVFLTEDGGAHFEKVETLPRATIFGALAFDPERPEFAYAASTAGLFRSADKGHKWSKILDAELMGQSIAFADGHALLVITQAGELKQSTDRGESWSVIALPAAPQGSFSVGLLNLVAHGERWVAVARPNAVLSSRSRASLAHLTQVTHGGDVVAFLDLAFTTQGDELVAATTSGLGRSRNGGRTWEMTPLPNDPALGAVLPDPNDAKHLYVSAHSNVYESAYGGNTWVDHDDIAGFGITDLILDPGDASTLYAATERGLYVLHTRQGVVRQARAPSATPSPRTTGAVTTGVVFTRGTNGVCPLDYKLQRSTCVHIGYLAATDPEKASQELAAYESGARSPVLSAGEVSAPGKVEGGSDVVEVLDHPLGDVAVRHDPSDPSALQATPAELADRARLKAEAEDARSKQAALEREVRAMRHARNKREYDQALSRWERTAQGDRAAQLERAREQVRQYERRGLVDQNGKFVNQQAKDTFVEEMLGREIKR